MKKYFIAIMSVLLLAGCNQKQPDTATENNSEPHISEAESSDTANTEVAESEHAETADATPAAHDGPLEFTDFAEVNLTTDRLSGFAKLEVNVDYEKLDELVGHDKLIDIYLEQGKANGKEYQDWEIEKLKKDTVSRLFVYYTAGMYDEKLKNGDVITIKGRTNITKDGNYGQSLEELNEKTGLDFPLSFEYTVSGLEEPEEKLDLMLENPQQYISIKPTSYGNRDLVDGNISLDFNFPDSYTNDEVYYMRKTNALTYEVVKDNERFGSITYEPIGVDHGNYVTGYGSDYGYSSGDTVIFELKFNDEAWLEKQKMSIPDRFFTYTIGSTNEYVNSFDDISDSDIDNLIRQEEEGTFGSTDPVVAVFKGQLKPEYSIIDHDGFVVGIIRKQDEGIFDSKFYYAITRAPDGSVTSNKAFSMYMFTDGDIPSAEEFETKDDPLSPNEKYTYEKVR